MLVVQPNQVPPCSPVAEVQQVIIPVGMLRMSVNLLPEQERRVIESRYGFNIAGVSLPVEEVARLHSLKAAEVRVLERAAIVRLRQELHLGVASSRAKVLPQLQQFRHQLRGIS